MRKLEKDLEKQKARLAKKQSKARSASNEEIALQELKQRLAKKGLTPEAFFRVFDLSMSRTVPVDKFKSMLQNFRLELSRGQISRLALILDEDMEGNITLQEYYNALEAYGQGAEKHFAPDGSDYYVPFEHRAMFKLLQILNDRGISREELFRSCDVDGSGEVNIQELETVLQGLSAEFYQKDCQAIHNFFDIDRNNECSEAEFMAQIGKAERLHQQHKQRLAGGKAAGAGSLRSDGAGEDGVMNELIPGWSGLTESSKTEKLTDFLIQTFKSRNLQPARVFAMANTRKADAVKLAAILEALGKLMPHLTKEFLAEIPRLHGLDPNTMVSKQEWLALFDASAGQKDGAPRPSAAKRGKQGGSDAAGDEANKAILKYLCEVLERENLTPQRLFKQVDRNWSGTADADELKDHLKTILPDLHTINMKKLMSALDLNGNGVVEEEEFVYLLGAAKASHADTSEFNKISAALLGKNAKQDYEKARAAKEEAKGPASVTLTDTVLPEDRVTHEQAY
jgi:Ca2+-binding EF-hand superfamily protein